MDQVKTIALAIWQQRFWVLSVTGILIALYCWNTATVDIETKFSQRKSAINSQFAAVGQITAQNSDFHPNVAVNKAGMAEVEAQKVLVGKLWSDLYQQQKNDVLFWPDLPGNDFANRMGKKTFSEEIERDLREQYFNHIKSQFDEIRKIVKASEPTSARANPNTKPVAGNYLVDWLDQEVLQGRLAFQSNKMPSSVKVWVIQEDIWVYKTLLNVIAKTNELNGATRSDNTAIRRILKLQVGRSAVNENLRRENIYIPAIPGDSAGYRSSDGAGSGLTGENLSQSGEGSDEALLDQRYLDEAGVPLEGASGDFGREYRKLPIRMVLLMDQRIIPQILVECANAPLPIEVTRLSVNRTLSNSTGFGDGAGKINQRTFDSSGKFENIRNLSTIEIQGIVLIYQPPEESYLPEEVAEEVVAEAAEEPTT